MIIYFLLKSNQSKCNFIEDIYQLLIRLKNHLILGFDCLNNFLIYLLNLNKNSFPHNRKMDQIYFQCQIIKNEN